MLSMLGWLGSVLYLFNHGYISVVKNWNRKFYYLVNFIAAAALVLSSLFISSFQAVVINGFWALISVLLLINFDVAKIPISRRIFYSGFMLIILWSIFVGVEQGWNSPVFIACIGWSSSFVFCLSYLLFCSNKLSQIQYLLLNTYAATALLPVLWSQQNWPAFALEVCWAGISAYGVFRRIEDIHLID